MRVLFIYEVRNYQPQRESNQSEGTWALSKGTGMLRILLVVFDVGSYACPWRVGSPQLVQVAEKHKANLEH